MRKYRKKYKRGKTYEALHSDLPQRRMNHERVGVYFIALHTATPDGADPWIFRTDGASPASGGARAVEIDPSTPVLIRFERAAHLPSGSGGYALGSENKVDVS